jgi:clan AA aspartic protease (TIGR02281 family)
MAPTAPLRPRLLRGLALALVGCLLGALAGGRAAAEIYEWKDRAGRLHFAQDLGSVPAEYRRQAEASARKEGAGPAIQTYRSPPASPAAASRSARGASARHTSGAGKVYRIKVPVGASSMRVNVRINDRVVAPVLIDTGATDVSMPAWVARELGLDLEKARTHYYNTANGIVQNRVVMLESVELGGARVEQVPASISESMSIGLLGLSYFNHFKYRIDPAAGIVTLEENGQVEAGRIRGGRSQGQWHNEFATLRRRREAVEQAFDEAGSTRARRKESLRAAIEEVDRQLEVLEAEADESRVPMSWRD